jgi:hypothetical protein
LKKRLPIGISDFKELIENNYYFVDTSNLITDIFNEASKISLITRPRRFGKTLNISMLRYFFDNRLSSLELFKDLKVSENTILMDKINSYPTIYISFKDITDNTWEVAELKLKNLLSKIYIDFSDDVYPVLKSDIEKKTYSEIVNKTANIADFQDSLKNLSEYLFKIYNTPVLLLIDEYDVPIQSGWSNGYYDEVIDFMRGLLSGVLKDNSYLFKGILTGIYRVAKESIFSGLNNLKVFSPLSKKYSEYFGFTENEVEDMLEYFDIESKAMKENIKTWYNGYIFGESIIYNPWSIINFLEDKIFKPYWINTSSNNLIIDLIQNRLKTDSYFRYDIETLIAGDSIEKNLDDTSALRELTYNKDVIWSLFLFSGYLKAENHHEDPKTEEIKYDCLIPNNEVMRFYRNTVINWLAKGNNSALQDLTSPLLEGKAEIFCENLKNYVRDTLSYYDIKGEPENTYHLILLGIFAHLSPAYWVKSNRESGKGRYDICLKAKDKNDFSAIIEIKSSVQKVEDAYDQIVEKEYEQELSSEGYTRIMKIGLGVDGKNIKTVFY